MAEQEVLIMAVTRMQSGVCTAGFVNRAHPASRLAWVRPVKEFGTLLVGDLTDADGRLIQLGDVVALELQQPRPLAPHAEDWICDFVYHRPRVLRQLTDERRARFLAEHVDRAPAEVLGPDPSRSLCLLRPDRVWASFALDAYSGKYEARLGFQIGGSNCGEATGSPRGLPVTDVKWRALGRTWLGNRGGRLALDGDELAERLAAEEVYLAVGLGRLYQGRTWPLVIGVHTVPDYEAAVDVANL
jgi:hypothetical protein